MALALRPAVLLIAIASLLFLLAGALDTLSGCGQAGGAVQCGELSASAIESDAFGVINLVVAVLIARGNERILAVRIGLAAFFVVERPVSAVAFGSKPLDVVGVHLLTAAVEAIILVSTLRLWRLGHSVGESDLRMLSLDTEAMALGSSAPEYEAPPPPIAAPPPEPMRVSKRSRLWTRAAGRRGRGSANAAGPASTTGTTVGRLAILLALALTTDTIVAAAAPGAALDVSSPRSIAAVLALVILAVSLPAVHGRPLALRLLLIVSLITFVERVFSPVALGQTDAPTLLLHAAAAVVAVVLAVASVSALRTAGRGAPVPA